MKKFKKACTDNINLLFFLLKGTQLNARLRSFGCLQFHQPTLEILNFTVDYLLSMENKAFAQHTKEERYRGHPINVRKENNQNFQAGGC